MTATEEVQIHVASINTRAATELCIRTVHQFAGHPFRLTVGDCGSIDGSIEMLQDFQRQSLLTLEVAPGGRRHADWLDGWLAGCQSRWALFIDSDMEFLAEGWLREAVAVAEEAGARLVCEYLSPSDPHYVSPINGVHLSLAARPSPWFLLVEAPVAREVDVSFAGTKWTDQVTGRATSYDVGGRLLEALQQSGHRAVQLPQQTRAKMVHYGGLSWLPGGRGVNRHQQEGGAPMGRYGVGLRSAGTAARQLRKVVVVHSHLRRVRRIQRLGIMAGGGR